MRRLFPLLLLLALPACGGGGEQPLRVAAPSASPAGGAPVLQLTGRCYGACAFVDPLGLPARVLYADGTVVAAEHTGPDPVATLRRGQADPARVRDLVALARRAGLDVGGESTLTYPDGPFFADGGGDVLTGRLDGRTTTVESPQSYDAALDGSSSDPEQRRLLRELAEALRALPAGEPYDADGVVLRAEPAGESASDGGAWTGPALADLPADGAARCAVLTGPEAARALEAVAQDGFPTVHTDGGRRWSVQARPVLPHERTCTDVAGTVAAADAGTARP